MSSSSAGGFAGHAKFAASSQRVKATRRAICAMLEGEGLHLSHGQRRDGLIYANGCGFNVPIDPKVETLRIKIGLNPTVPLPRELVHSGRQPDWIVVRPEREKIALGYLRQLARSGLL